MSKDFYRVAAGALLLAVIYQQAAFHVAAKRLGDALDAIRAEARHNSNGDGWGWVLVELEKDK